MERKEIYIILTSLIFIVIANQLHCKFFGFLALLGFLYVIFSIIKQVITKDKIDEMKEDIEEVKDKIEDKIDDFSEKANHLKDKIKDKQEEIEEKVKELKEKI
jgi:septal ring factor EnvC (AmiA/AmiB activator)